MADIPIPTLPIPTNIPLSLNITGSLPGEAVITEWIKLQEKLYDKASPEVQAKIADDVGKSLDRLWTIWEKLLNFLHIPGAIKVDGTSTKNH